MKSIILKTQAQRDYAKKLIDEAPDNYVVSFKERTRSLDQNALMWALLEDIADAKPDGRDMDKEVWKGVFLYEIGIKSRFEPNLSGDGMVVLPPRSSNLSVGQFSELIECIYAYGAQHGIVWRDYTHSLMEERNRK